MYGRSMRNQLGKFFIIDSGYFCAAIEVGGTVAPILHYMKTWDEQKIKSYCKKKGWKLTEWKP